MRQNIKPDDESEVAAELLEHDLKIVRGSSGYPSKYTGKVEGQDGGYSMTIKDIVIRRDSGMSGYKIDLPRSVRMALGMGESDELLILNLKEAVHVADTAYTHHLDPMDPAGIGNLGFISRYVATKKTDIGGEDF